MLRKTSGEILMKLKNGLGQLFYGLHMSEGVAEYRDPGVNPYRIYLAEDTIKNMDVTFRGRPVYVHHVDEVNVEKIREEADGYVIRSFYNKADGKHWAEFMIVTDRGLDAIRNGWKLSNAYVPKDFGMGGLWHGVEYEKEVTNAEYEHLAIVPNPRYDESIILTPEQFKLYNEQKEVELHRLANSKDKGEPMKLQFWKKTKLENSADLTDTMVELPKSKKVLSVEQIVNAYDAILNGYMCNGDEMVKVGDAQMSVNELVTKHLEMVADRDKMKENEGAEDKKENEDAEAMENEDVEDKKENEDVEDKKENEDVEEMAEKKKNKKKKNATETTAKDKKDDNFNKVLNAPFAKMKDDSVIELAQDQIARGKNRYGSN